MDELIIDEKRYISSKHAAKITGYAKDYVGQLCREGRVEARLVGRSWYVLEDSIKEHRYGKEEEVREETEAKTNEPTQIEEAIPASSSPNVTYFADETPFLPELDERKEELVAFEAKKDTPEPISGVSDMESAWREWFTSRAKNEASHEAPIVPSETSIQEGSEEHEEGEEKEEEAEKPVFLHIEREDHADRRRNVHRERVEENETVVVQGAVPRKVFIPVFGTPVIKATLIAAALVAVCVALLGTGFTARYIGEGLYTGTVIDAISGVNIVNK